MADVDLVVLGAGPGGYVAALRARQLGLSVTVVEADRAGGVCGNWGCIPSKALLSDAALVAAMKDAGRRGIQIDGLKVDFAQIVARSRAVAAQQANGVEFLFRKAGVTLQIGRGTLVEGGVEVTDAKGVTSHVAARSVLLATGSVERTLPGIPIDGQVVVTSREALDHRELPPRVVVVGGGAIGVELAYVYASFGSTVTVVEMAPALLPTMDADLGKELHRQFSRQNIEVLVGTRVAGCERSGATATVTVAGPDGERALEAEMVLIAVGRRPQLDGLGLEAAGVRTERGAVVVDASMRTSVANVWAIGDLVGPMLLAHSASAQGVIAAEAIAGRPTAPGGIDPTRVPVAVYCEPEVAAVGLTEAEARARGGEIAVGTFPFRALGKAMATGHTAGFVKVVLDRRYGEVLGVHMIGHGVTELIAEATLARSLEATADDVIAAIHAHPTMAEGFREAMLAAMGEAVNV